MPRTILHLDLDAFFCAVEEQRDPALRGTAFAVGGRADRRGVVASCSYAARRSGVRSAMPMARALHLCPGLIVVPHRHDAYRTASRAVMARLHNTTPLVEQISIDEAFMDVTGLPGAGADLARRIQAAINAEMGLPCSFGVAANKLVAKIANTIGKDSATGDGPPNAITVVPPGEEAAFMAPLPVRELWGIGPKTAEKLAGFGVHTIGDVAGLPPGFLAQRFGKTGAELALRAQGIDDRPVVTEHDARSISKETTFTRDVTDGDVLRHTLRQLADDVGRRLRGEGLRGGTVRLKLRWADFTTFTRQTAVSPPVDQDGAIYAAALRLFEQAWPPGQPVRLIGVGVAGLQAQPVQLSLWDTPAPQDDRRLLETLDKLRDRFGGDIIRRASDLEQGDRSDN
jgi:DNA polymerase-4